MNPHYGHVYLLRNTVNGRVYVGQTIRSVATRFREHICEAKTSRKRLYAAIRKHGADKFIVETLHSAPDQVELDRLETEEIAKHRSSERDFGYNMTPGGDQGTNAEEARRRISESKLGIPKTPEHRRKLSEANKGKPKLAATKAALIAANTGRVFSEEHRAKIGLKHRGKTVSVEARTKISASHTGKVLTPEHRAAIGVKNLGNKHNLGHRASEDTRKKLSLARSGENNPFFGKTHSPETREKIRLVKSTQDTSGEKNPFFGKKHSPETRERMREGKRRAREARKAQDGR